eukprot:1146420-Pelagomonas_calceolata.AAC.2
MVHLVPTTKSQTVLGFAKCFRDCILRLHGMPNLVPRTKAPQFDSLSWKQMTALTGIKRRMSSTYHPKTDGQTERTNCTLERKEDVYTLAARPRALRKESPIDSHQ